MGGIFAHTTGDEYTEQVQIPQYAENGTWKVAYVFVVDNVLSNGLEEGRYSLSCAHREPLSLWSRRCRGCV